MTGKTTEYTVNCKRCGKPIGYSGMMYEKMKEFGHSRPEYCEECRKQLAAEKMTMGAAYYQLQTYPGVTREDEPIPGELGKVYHPDRPHIKTERPKTFDASKFGATPGKIVEIYEWLKDPEHQVAIVQGGTGSGKSTALPYWLIDPPEGVPHDFFTRDGQIVITQPRIVATTGITKYLGTLLGSSVGKGFDIGYRYSKDRNADKFNAAFMATDGTLINLIKQGQLSEISVVMIDEAHERSLNIDIILHLLKDQLPLYPHLKLLIVSATINAQQFLDYFGKDTAALIEFEPKAKFTYECHFADEKEKIAYEDPNRLKKQLTPAMIKMVLWLLNEQVEGRKPAGDILGFLQGVKPIEEAVAGIRAMVDASPKLKGKVEVLPLYSALEEAESDRAIAPAKAGITKVVLSTNVAEASITVEGVVYVIESGVENQAQWEIQETKKSVELRLISKANAKQRWGRSGRTRNGEVYCLYTEKQFAAMLDFPIPAIHRSSMEEIILRLKELGIDDYDQNWLDTPITAELNRSVDVLKKNGAIDDQNRLTEYGALLTQFAYPSDLANLIITADIFGCAVEVASILPIIKAGGFRSFLLHDTTWDEATKQRVAKIQSALWSGCKDEVEFIFRLMKYWNNPPQVSADEKNKNDLLSRRKAFTEAFYLNRQMFEEDILPEKARILQLLTSRRKDRSTREIDLRLINRTRAILRYCSPCKLVKEGEYVYNPRVSLASGENSHCELWMPADKAEEIDKQKKQGSSQLKLGRIFNYPLSEDIGSMKKRIYADPVMPVEDVKAFDDFVKLYPVGRELVVEAMDYAEHAGDFRVSLTVVEPKTGYRTWLTPADLSFTQSSAALKQIPLGTKLKTVVKSVDTKNRFVRLSCLPFVEDELMKFLKTVKLVDGQVILKARVIEVRNDKKIIFLAEISRPADGFILTLQANEKVLNKPFTDYKAGETYLVSFRRETDFEYKANLLVLPEKIGRFVSHSGSRLGWNEGKLSYRGRMTREDWLELSVLDTSETFQSALDFLYLTSNINWVSSVKDADWAAKAQQKYKTGSAFEVTVTAVLKVGIIVTLKDGQSGFIRVTDPGSIKVGEKYTAKVIGLNEDRQQVTLSLDTHENSPANRYKKGQIVEGVVGNVTDYGAFVNFGPGYSGLIHISKMGRRVNRPSDLLSKGNRVRVEILDIREEGGRLKISLGLKEIL